MAGLGVSSWVRALLVAVSVGVPGCAGDGAPETRSDARDGTTTMAVPGGSVARIDHASGAVQQVIGVGDDPLLLVVASGHPWTLNFGDGSLSRIDPTTNEATTVRIGVAVGIASDGTDLWVAYDGTKLARLDGASGVVKASFTLAAQPLFALRDAGFLGVDAGTVWLTVPVLGRPDEPQSLWRIDASTGAVLGKLPIGPDPRSPLPADSHVWVVTGGDERVVRIDPVSGATTGVPAGPLPVGLAWGADSLWVGHERAETGIWRIDPETLQPMARIPAPAAVRGLAFGDGVLWVATEEGVLRIDASTNSIVQRVRLTERRRDLGPIGVVLAGEVVWVSAE